MALQLFPRVTGLALCLPLQAMASPAPDGMAADRWWIWPALMAGLLVALVLACAATLRLLQRERELEQTIDHLRAQAVAGAPQP